VPVAPLLRPASGGHLGEPRLLTFRAHPVAVGARIEAPLAPPAAVDAAHMVRLIRHGGSRLAPSDQSEKPSHTIRTVHEMRSRWAARQIPVLAVVMFGS